MRRLILTLLFVLPVCAQAMTYSCNDQILKEVNQSLLTWTTAADIQFVRVVDNAELEIRDLTGNPDGVYDPNFVYYTSDMTMAIGRKLGIHSFSVVVGQNEVDEIRTLLNLSPRVFDFGIKTKGRKVQVLCAYPVDWFFSDQFYVTNHKRVVHVLPKGAYTVTMKYHGIHIMKVIPGGKK